MKIKKISAENTQIAMQKIKKLLGEDAIILHVEDKIDRSTRQRFVEVTAAMDEELQQENIFLQGKHHTREWREPQAEVMNPSGVFDERNFGFTYTAQNRGRNSEQSSAWPGKHDFRFQSQPDFSELQEVKDQLQSLSLLLQGSGYPELPPPLLENYVQLINAGVEKKLALQIVKSLEDKVATGANNRQAVRKEVIRNLERFIGSFKSDQITTGKQQKVRIFIGPTGVGKTTCIAKLSAIDKIYHHKKVGLISIDTYRIAAIEQLRTYAKITKLPLEVVYKPQEMRAALQFLADYDVICVDTPGRSPRNYEALKEMLSYFNQCFEPEIHLVLSLTSKEADLHTVVESFSMFPIGQLLFTKLDETTSIGSILGVLNKAKKPISYISTGQNVPDDIVQPENNLLARFLMGEKIS